MHIRKKENCFAQFHFFVFTNRYRSINEREMADFWSRSAQGKAAPIFCIKGTCEVSCFRAKQANGRTSSSRPASREATKKRWEFSNGQLKTVFLPWDRNIGRTLTSRMDPFSFSWN